MGVALIANPEARGYQTKGILGMGCFILQALRKHESGGDYLWGFLLGSWKYIQGDIGETSWKLFPYTVLEKYNMGESVKENRSEEVRGRRKYQVKKRSALVAFFYGHWENVWVRETGVVSLRGHWDDIAEQGIGWGCYIFNGAWVASHEEM